MIQIVGHVIDDTPFMSDGLDFNVRPALLVFIIGYVLMG